MKMFPLLMLLPTLGCYGADETRGTTNQIADQELIRQVQSLRERGVTNVTEADLRRDPLIWITNAFLVHTALPMRIWDWPAPQTADTNRLAGVFDFINRHGWSMDKAPTFFPGAGVPLQPITGLPWPAIAGRTFSAVTRNGVLYVVLGGFGPECAGVAWNPKTNSFDVMIQEFQPLGRGWYAWSQTMFPSPDARRYEGEDAKPGQQDGSANGSQPIRSETNRAPGAAGSRR